MASPTHPPPVSCRLTEKAAFLMSVTASPSHHQCLTLILALIFSQLPHPECWMPRLPLETPRLLLACFACLVPGARLGLVSMWRRCLCHDARSFCVHAASRSRGAILWSFGSCCRITTVPVLFLFPPFVAQTFLILSTQTEFIRQVDVSPSASQPLLPLLLAFFSFPFSPP